MSKFNAPTSPQTKQYISHSPRSLYSPPDFPRSYHSPPYSSDLRTKLVRKMTRSRSPVDRRDYRNKSRSPTRPYSRQTTMSPRRKFPSFRARTRSPQFKTPYYPRRNSGDDRNQGGSSYGERSSLNVSERSSSRYQDRRSSSKISKEKSSSRHPRENSSKKLEVTDSTFRSGRNPSEQKNRSSSHRPRKSLPHSSTHSRRFVEPSPEHQDPPSAVVADVEVESSVNRILKNIMTKTEKKKRGKKNQKLELVLKKSKKKRCKKVQVKSEPVTYHEPSPSIALNIKPEPEVSPPPPPPPPPTTSSHQYFKPGPEIELQPILGHSKCRICKSYFPDADDRRSQHLAQHPDRVFVVNLPMDTYYYDIEEAISHLAKFGINRTELHQKVKDCNLIKLPTNMKGFSCNICKVLDTNSEKEFVRHVKEECKVVIKEEKAKHLVCFCRGCHERFRSKIEMEQHVGKRGCWPSMMVINRLYDISGGEVRDMTKDKAAMDKEKMVKVKKEKIERAHQIEVKRERFVKEAHHLLPQLHPLSSPSSNQPKFNAYSLPSSQEVLQTAHPLGLSTSDLHKILHNVQPNQVTQQQMDMSTSHMQQMDMATIRHMQGIQQMPKPLSQTLNHQMLENFSIPPPNFPSHPPNILSTSLNTLNTKPPHSKPIVKTEGEAISHLRDSHSNKSRSRSSHPSESVLVPPSTPLPTMDSMFSRGLTPSRTAEARMKSYSSGGSTALRQRYPSGSSIASCESLDIQQALQNTKVASTANCQRSACLWTDPHTSTCSKMPIMNRCSTDTCSWFDLHRTHPLCDKLSFYCNCKKEREGVYEYYDRMPQVQRIPTQLEGMKDTTVMEPKNVIMRLLYRKDSKVVSDPRLLRTNYPVPQNIPARTFRGGGRRGWGKSSVICTWSGASMVQIRSENNPHMEEMDIDHDSDLEICGKVEKETSTGERSKITRVKGDGASSPDIEIL